MIVMKSVNAHLILIKLIPERAKVNVSVVIILKVQYD